MISDNITDLSMFNKINFVYIKIINIFSYNSTNKEKYIPTIEQNFNSLTAFKYIRAKKLDIYSEENKLKFNVHFINPELNIYFHDENFIYSDIFLYTIEISIQNSLLNIDGNSTNIFPYKKLKKLKFSILKEIFCEKININYKENEYLYNISFSNPKLNLSFKSKDLSFFETKKDLLLKCKEFTLSNLTLNTFENLDSLKTLELNNININNFDVLIQIYKQNIESITSNNVKCNKDFIDDLEIYDFEKEIYFNSIRYKKSSFSFDIIINKIFLNDSKSLKNCTYMNLSQSNINENDLSFLSKEYFFSLLKLNLSSNDIKIPNFLSYDSLRNLKEVYLLNNKIEDISYFIEKNISSKNITKLNLQKNKIRTGLEVLKQDFFDKRYIYIQINEITKLNEEYLISLEFKEHLYNTYLFKYKSDENILTGFDAFYLDFYLNDLNNIWNIIDKKYTFFKCNPKLIEPSIIKEDELDEKDTIFYLLLNISYYHYKKFDDYIDKDSIIVQYVYKLLYNKGYSFFKDLSIIENLKYFNDIKTYFSFLNLNSDIELFNLTDLDLSDNKIIDIRFLCGDIPFINLKKLKINNCSYIKNFSELKNAKFIDLEELCLVNDGLEDLNEIEMDKYPFKNLIILDLKENSIYKIEPIYHFTKLKY